MASKKSSSPQSGTVTTPNAPPFASARGTPTNVSPGRPTDLVGSRGEPNASARGGDHNFWQDPNGSPGEGPRPRDLHADPSMNPAQTPSSPMNRVSPKEVPKGGTSIPVDPGAVRRGGVGSIGNPAKPFRGMK